GYQGPGMGLRDSNLREGYNPKTLYPESKYIPSTSRDGHLDPEADMKRHRNEKMMQQQGPIMPPPGMQFGPPPMLHIPPIPAFPPPPSLPLKNGAPQSMNPSSVFNTVRLSSADLNTPADAPRERFGVGAAGYPSAARPFDTAPAAEPAPRQTV